VDKRPWHDPDHGVSNVTHALFESRDTKETF